MISNKFFKYWVFLIIILMSNCNSKREIGRYETGELHYEVPLKNGKRDGILKQYYKTGELQLFSEWKNGKKKGITKTFYKNGQTKTIEIFRNNLLQDTAIYYDSLGQILEIFPYFDGKLEGNYKAYYNNGQMEVRGKYCNGKKCGKAWIFYPDGEIKRKRIYLEDSIIYDVEYDTKGRISTCYLNINTKVNSSGKFKVELVHWFYNNGYIKVIIGKLNDEGLLIERNKEFISPQKKHTIIFDKLIIKDEKNYIEGYLYELDSLKEIQAKYPFKHDIRLNKNVFEYHYAPN